MLMIILLVYMFHKSKKEGFEMNNDKWPLDLIQRFNTYQLTVNANFHQYNMDMLQNQATVKEAEDYLKNGYWFWSEDLKELYKEKIRHNRLLQIDPNIALNDAMKIYNQNAITQLLAWNSKEGEFLLYGIKLNNGEIIKCSDNGILEKNGKSILPTDVPGFSFIDDECNPCDSVDITNKNQCKFKLNINGNDDVSLAWSKIWNLQ